jgi:hypothetical protein
MYVKFNKEKEENTMKYETPQLTALTPAINAIRAPKPVIDGQLDSKVYNEFVGAYADWE